TGGPLECPGGAAARGFGLEEELKSKLYQPGVACLPDLAELLPVRGISVRVEELRVVEDIEELGAEINPLSLRQRDGLQYRKISIADMGSAADCPLGVT